MQWAAAVAHSSQLWILQKKVFSLKLLLLKSFPGGVWARGKEGGEEASHVVWCGGVG